VDCTNLALKGPAVGTNTCGWNAGTPVGWQNLQSGNAAAGQFHYDVDASTIYSQGAVRLTSTGRVNGKSRTIQVLVSRGGSTDFLYYTDFEDADPANEKVYGSGGPSRVACGRNGPSNADYYWQNSSRGCVEIQFATGDVLDGAVHFNDTPLMGGSVLFQKGYETADPRCSNTPYNINNCKRGGGNPNLNSFQAKYAPLLYLPDNSDQFATFPGCRYTGNTRIRFNSNGTMTVWSSDSQGTSVGAGCTDGGSWIGRSQTVNVPNEAVVYVKNDTSTHKCAAGEVGDGIPISQDINRDLSTFYCGTGNMYVEGTVKGRVTLASQNNIIVTGDLLLASTPRGSAPTGPDMVGLVASNSVVVYHPVKSNGNNLISINDRWIYASIQTLQHSFWVQSYDDGNALGDLAVRGSIAQRWRGIVGTSGGTGFLKDYGYDARLKYASPPYFPQWTNAVWAAKTTAELAPAY
jgi:hypothetical protein